MHKKCWIALSTKTTNYVRKLSSYSRTKESTRGEMSRAKPIEPIGSIIELPIEPYISGCCGLLLLQLLLQKTVVINSCYVDFRCRDLILDVIQVFLYLLQVALGVRQVLLKHFFCLGKCHFDHGVGAQPYGNTV